jgi:hypothetical protein
LSDLNSWLLCGKVALGMCGRRVGLEKAGQQKASRRNALGSANATTAGNAYDEYRKGGKS